MNEIKRLAVITGTLLLSVLMIRVHNTRARAATSNKSAKKYKVVCLPKNVTFAKAKEKLKGNYHIMYKDKEGDHCYFKFSNNNQFSDSTPRELKKANFSPDVSYPGLSGKMYYFTKSDYSQLIRLLKSPKKQSRKLFNGTLVASVDEAVRIMKN